MVDFDSSIILSTPSFLSGIKHFNEQDFFSAHDFFEEVWFECKGNSKEYIQGLIQISAGLFHVISRKYSGGISLILKGKSKIEENLEFFPQIDTLFIVSKLEKIIFDIREIFNNKKTDFDYLLLSEIKLVIQNKE